MAHQLPQGLYLVMPGYYYDADTDELLSLKSGVLRPIKKKRLWLYGSTSNHVGWQVSHNGIRRSLRQDFIKKNIQSGALKTDSTIEVHRKEL